MHTYILQFKVAPLLAILALGCFAFSTQMQAATDTPDPGSVAVTNTADGDGALVGVTGFYNSAFGWLALLSNGAASFNTGVGAGALLSNTGPENTAVGTAALFSNTTSNDNTACGAFALFTSTGQSNTAVGARALQSNTIGAQNTSIGINSLINNTEGNLNTALGGQTLSANTIGSNNTAIGKATLINSTGDSNTALGFNSGNNVITASSVTCIGSGAAGADVSNTTWISNVFGVTTQSGTTAPVIVSDGGQLGTLVSSERFKTDIAAMEKASETILALRPVTFHYKTDTKGVPQFGLIAEEVAKVNPALVLPDKEGKPFTVRYDAVNAMLLNEFLKEHRKVEQLEEQVAALTAGLQKVSAQIELSKPAPQSVLNSH
jgi:endosialidase-like protein